MSLRPGARASSWLWLDSCRVASGIENCDMTTDFESDSVELLQLLRDADRIVLDDYNKFGRLAWFIATQFYRTPRMARRVVRSAAGLGSAINIEAAWGLLRTIYSTTVGFSILASRERTKMTFLDPPNGEEFITGDQPIINNLRAVGLPDGVVPAELELYYPLDPRRALVVNFEGTEPTVERTAASATEVLRYNRLIKEASEGQVYARSDRALAGL